MIDDNRFYDSVMRYTNGFWVGLPDEYLTELINEDIDGRTDKFAFITCFRTNGINARFRCAWTSQVEENRGAGCPRLGKQRRYSGTRE